MKNKAKSKEFRIKKLPYFKPGSLVFRGSGHNLIKDGEYYRCGKASNQLCDFHDRRVKSETLERAFSRLAKNLHQKQVDLEPMFKKIMQDGFVELLFGMDERTLGKDELGEATLEVMKEDVESGKKIKKSDEEDFYENYMNNLRAEHPIMLFGLALGVGRLIGNKLPEAEMGRSLALLSKRIYITDRGTIHSIELERWAWYSIQLASKHALLDIEKFTEKLKVVNEPDALHRLSVSEAALKFDTEDFPSALNENFLVPVVMMKYIKESLDNILTEDPEEMKKNSLELLNEFQNNPVLRILFGAATIFSNKKSK